MLTHGQIQKAARLIQQVEEPKETTFYSPCVCPNKIKRKTPRRRIVRIHLAFQINQDGDVLLVKQ